MTRPLPELVEITWHDSAIAVAGWEELDDVEKACAKMYRDTLHSAGYLIVDRDDYVVVVASINRAREQVASGIMIPRSAIVRTRHLGEGE